MAKVLRDKIATRFDAVKRLKDAAQKSYAENLQHFNPRSCCNIRDSLFEDDSRFNRKVSCTY